MTGCELSPSLFFYRDISLSPSPRELECIVSSLLRRSKAARSKIAIRAVCASKEIREGRENGRREGALNSNQRIC